jgi:hypothetical protein
VRLPKQGRTIVVGLGRCISAISWMMTIGSGAVETDILARQKI